MTAFFTWQHAIIAEKLEKQPYAVDNGLVWLKVPDGWTPPLPPERKRRRTKNGASKARRELVKRRDGYRCKRCPSQTDLCVDHIIPVSRGGTHDVDNLQTLCRRCNSKKGCQV